MAAIDWSNPAAHKLLVFVVERYGCTAAEVAFDMTRGMVRGYVHRNKVKIALSENATKFSALELFKFCVQSKLEYGGMPSFEGEVFGNPVMGKIATASVEKSQAEFVSRFANKGVYRPTRRRTPVVVEAPISEPPKKPRREAVLSPRSTPKKEEVVQRKEAPAPTITSTEGARAEEVLIYETDHSSLVVTGNTTGASLLPSSLGPKFAHNTPIRDRVPSMEQLKKVEAEDAAPAVDFSENIDFPGENPARLAVLKKKFPNAVNFFKAKSVTVGGLRVNRCRTPLWNLSADCLASSPEKRISYDDSRPDASRYICGNPTDAPDSYTCRECRKQLGQAPYGRYRFLGKGDSSAKRF